MQCFTEKEGIKKEEYLLPNENKTMPDISAAIRNAVSEKTAEIQRLADQLEDILSQAGLAQRRGRHKDSRCEDIKNICQDIADEVTPP
jgi:hypothetical protein